MTTSAGLATAQPEALAAAGARRSVPADALFVLIGS